MFGNFYRGKTVLVTGHTGFKGAWLSLWLRELGANVLGFSLEPHASPNLYEVLATDTFFRETIGDLRKFELVKQTFSEVTPDFVFHLAAQPIVRRSYEEPLETATTNILGTIHVLEALRQNEIGCPVVVVTSDKCYENVGPPRAFVETDPLGGYDVYSASKAAVEVMGRSWARSFNLRVATARAGNVIGGGDYGEDRIVPDCVRFLHAREVIAVRNPHAVRPWQHVLDCISGYLWLGARLASDETLADAFNFGPKSESSRTVKELVEEFLRHWPGEWQDASSHAVPREAVALCLNIEKARECLEWQPILDFPKAVEYTAQWYHARETVKAKDMHLRSLSQLEEYIHLAGETAVWVD